MNLKLRQAAAAYDRADQADVRGAIERADKLNWKRGADITLVGVKLTIDGADVVAGTPLSVTIGGTGTPTAFTAGSVVFAGASGVYGQDNAHLFWDATNFRLGIGIATPRSRLTLKQGSDVDYTATWVLERSGTTDFWGTVVATDDNYYFGYNGTSVANINHTSGAFTAISDARLKTNVATYSGGLNAVLALRPVTYILASDATDAPQIGLIAQETMQVVPEVVSPPPDVNGFYGINYAGLVPVLIAAVQELTAQVAALQSK